MKYYIIHVFQTNMIHFFSDENVLQKTTPAFFTFLSCISVSNCFLITLYISFKPSLSNQEKKRVSGKTCKQMANRGGSAPFCPLSSDPAKSHLPPPGGVNDNSEDELEHGTYWWLYIIKFILPWFLVCFSFNVDICLCKLEISVRKQN